MAWWLPSLKNFITSGGTGTTDLGELLTPGSNRVVVTQVDDCEVGNNLQSAVATLNGGPVDVGTCN